MLEDFEAPFVIAMSIFVMAIYAYVGLSVRGMKKQVASIHLGAVSFIDNSNKTFKIMRSVAQEIQDKITSYMGKDPAQHLFDSYAMLLETLGARDLKGVDPGIAARIKLIQRGAKTVISQGVKDAVPKVKEEMMGGDMGDMAAMAGQFPGIADDPMLKMIMGGGGNAGAPQVPAQGAKPAQGKGVDGKWWE